MTYKSVWWYPNYIEYGAGLNPGKTWPQVQEQYSRPHPLYDLRHYDLPTEEYEAKLYYRLPRLGQPKYRGLFRDKPHTIPSYYPEEWPQGKPVGFHGRVYYEDGPPQFKYDGPKLDKLYWLERPPYLPAFPNVRPPAGPPTGLRRSTNRYTEYTDEYCDGVRHPTGPPTGLGTDRDRPTEYTDAYRGGGMRTSRSKAQTE